MLQYDYLPVAMDTNQSEIDYLTRPGEFGFCGSDNVRFF